MLFLKRAQYVRMRVFPHGQVRASIENGFASGYIYARDARSRRFERMHFYFVRGADIPEEGKARER